MGRHGTVATTGLVVAMMLIMVPSSACGPSGQGCNDVGCLSGVEVQVPVDLVADAAYDVEICVDDDCQREVLNVVPPDEEVAGVFEGDVEMDFIRDTVFLTLPDGTWSGVHQVRATISGEASDTLVEVAREVEFSSSQPNGAACGPTCWFARVSA